MITSADRASGGWRRLIEFPERARSALVPAWLKRPIVPIWNSSIHGTRAFGEVAAALLSGRFARCNCCGHFGPVLLRRRSIRPRLIALWGLSQREAAALVRKETLLCVFCGAKLRARRIARVVVDRFRVSDPSPKSLREWADRYEVQGLRVAEINRIEGVHEAIAGLPLLSFSDFADPDHHLPSEIAPSEDLTRLSYPDEHFDLVLTSETLEHVPDLAASLLEIRRVLKPGGLHIFTVPLRPGVPKTFARATIGPDGRITEHAPPISHPGGDWGYPVFTEFGADLVSIFDQAGFETTTHFGPTTEDDLAQVYVSRKR